MIPSPPFQLLLNEESHPHGSIITQCLEYATHFDCLVAFAKLKGLEELKPTLEGRLKAGMTANFIVGLDFYITDPTVIVELGKLQASFKSFRAYVARGKDGSTFHPKIYRFESSHGVTLIVGSANLTGGGLRTNDECSVQLQLDHEYSVSSLFSLVNRSRRNRTRARV